MNVAGGLGLEVGTLIELWAAESDGCGSVFRSPAELVVVVRVRVRIQCTLLLTRRCRW